MHVAIVGIGCRLPGGVRTPDEFWRLLCDGVDAITEVPSDRFDVESLYDSDPAHAGTLYTRWGGFVEAIDRFDADFFGISPREARRMDPQHRLLLEVVWEALEDGGQPPDGLTGSNTGVFVGISSHDYGDMQIRPAGRTAIDAHVNPGNAGSIAPNRISYLLDLRGPSFAVDTACSSSLTAVHLACRSLAGEECELAVVAGVNALLTPEPTIGFCRASMLAPDGRCKPFDARADGYVRSEGAGAVVLKPLERALANDDPIYAVIRGTAINQDGRTPGIAVPSAAGQQAVAERALRHAGVSPSAVHYVEAHGTGTPVGDPREAQGIGAAMAPGRPAERPCLIGSAKGNVGHLEAAAGIVGLIKTALSLERRRIPPTIHFEEPSPTIPFEELRLRVPTVLEDWPAGSGRAIACVSSFGFGGANASTVLEEPPPPRPAASEGGRAQLLPLSARSPEALRELAGAYARLLRDTERPRLRDMCSTAAVRRSHHDHRLALVGSSADELAGRLDAVLAGEAHAATATGRRARDREPRLAFVYSGMGPERAGMARGLLCDEPVFRAAIEECDRVLAPLTGWSLTEELAADEERSRIARTDVAQVVNVAVQVALTQLWRSWGIVADAVVGHSVGEVAAAWAGGALGLEDTLRLAVQRGRLLDRASGTGGMLAAGISHETATALVDGLATGIAIAAVNAPTSVTFSGPEEALSRLAESLDRQGCFNRMLAVNVPYHSPQIDELRDELVAALGDLDSRVPDIPIVSTATGVWQDGRPFDAEYWWANMRQPVLFTDALERLIEDGCDTFLEVGAHPALAVSMTECLEASGREGLVLPSLRRNEDDRTVMLRSLAALYARGRLVDWVGVADNEGRCVRLPRYPWQGERHWFEPPAVDDGRLASVDSGHPLLGRRVRAARPTWEVELAGPRLAYLDGHAVESRVVFPGAAYVEQALAAAAAVRGTAVPAIERVEFERLLALPERDSLRLQCLVDERDGSIEIHSSLSGEPLDWALHATARIAHRPAGVGETVDLRALRERLPTEVAVDSLYRTFEESGLRYDGAFRAVAGLWRGHGQALGRIEFPAGVELSVDGYHVHPALLDSAFQVLGAAAAEALAGHEGALVPVSIARVESRAAAGARFWSHGSVSRADGSELEGSVRLLDDAGRVVLDCEGLRLRLLDDMRSESIGDWLYEESWELEPRRDDDERAFLAAPELAAAVQPVLDELVAENAFASYYGLLEPALNALAVAYVRDALVELGYDSSRDATADAGSLGASLGVAPRHYRFFGWLLELVRTGEPPAAGGSPPELAADGPYSGAVLLLKQSGERLARTLRGDDDAREWLFADESLRALAGLYGDNPWFSVYSAAVAEVVARAQEDCRPRPLRVLEVGAGTGGTTAPVLARLGPDALEYVLTDVSPFFVKSAAERFRDRSHLRAEVLDVEQPPPETGAFDVVVAADVVHATADVRRTLRNLRSCLAPGGLLVLLEATRRSPWLELIFGQLEGWWRFGDLDLRPTHPLLGVRAWEDVLTETGFAATASLAEEGAHGGEPLQTLILASSPAADDRSSAATTRRWLMLTDRRGVGAELASLLRERGHECTLVWPGAGYRRFGVDGVELSPTSPADWTRLVEEQPGAGGIIHLWSLDAPDEPTTEELMEFQRVGCGSVVSLVQAFGAAGGALPEPWLVTRGAQAVDPADDGPTSVAQAPLWGLGRVLRSEQGSGCRLVDLSPAPRPEEIDALATELEARDGPDELALRADRRLVRRLRRAARETAAAPERAVLSPANASFHAEVVLTGAPETIELRETLSLPVGPGEVAVRVVAAGLNFRDVLLALGMPFAPGSQPGESAPLGWEFAGVVEACGEGVGGVRPGDEVMGGAWRAFGSRVVAREEGVVSKPAGLTFEEAATVPVAFLTADYALNRLANVAPGERVLVHSATGGVGLAAVQLARLAGAEVLATAGTPEKRAHLLSLGIEHVFDSRSLAFADEVLERTGGEGVDVVLNSLPGEALARGVRLLRPWGRFVELGKRDFYEDTKLGLGPFSRNLSFFALDLGQLFEHRPAVFQRMLRTISRRLEAGEIEPLPYRAFDLAEAGRAIGLMAKARHIGKIVLSVREATYEVGLLASEPLFRSDSTYVLAGGLGGFGLALAGWMAREGAGSIALTSRSGVPRDEDRAALDALLSSSAEVAVISGDVADRDELERVLARIRATMPPIAGVVHAAMILDDGPLERLDYARFEAVLAPKVAGAWNLHELTLDDDLELFVLFSSISALVGPPTQGSYAAANAFLGALAAHRRALGLPAVAVDWGVLREVGYVARRPELGARLARYGFKSMAVDDAFSSLREAIRGGRTRVAIARLDETAPWHDPSSWQRQPSANGSATGAVASSSNNGAGRLDSELAAAPAVDRQRILEEHLAERTARVLETSPDRVDLDRPLPELGLDSLMAVELRTAVRTDVGVEIPIVDLLEALTLRKLATAVLERLPADDDRR